MFLEPLFFKAQISWLDFLSAMITFVGLIIIVPEFDLGSTALQGVLWGILTAFFVAILLILIRKKAQTISGSLMTFYSNLVTVLLILPFWFWFDHPHALEDYGFLLLLGVVATAFGHTLGSHAMKYITATTACIVSALEPIYSVLIAFFWLGETPELRTITGGLIILSVVIFESVKHNWVRELPMSERP